jgi:hypothetical protein
VNDAPTAVAGGPYTRRRRDGNRFRDGSGSSDVEAGTLLYQWNFGDGGTGAGVQPAHTYADNGVYTATLTVTDAAGATDVATARLRLRM